MVDPLTLYLTLSSRSFPSISHSLKSDDTGFSKTIRELIFSEYLALRQIALSHKLGVSRDRVNQDLRLLKLPLEIQESVIRMGDPFPPGK